MAGQDMDEFTRGPWEVRQLSRHGLTGFTVDTVNADLEICEIYPKPNPVAVSRANANLIAAAPRLYTTLVEARNFVADELKTYLECACVLSIETLEPQRHTLEDDEREHVEELEAKLASIDGALAEARGQE